VSAADVVALGSAAAWLAGGALALTRWVPGPASWLVGGGAVAFGASFAADWIAARLLADGSAAIVVLQLAALLAIGAGMLALPSELDRVSPTR
jgi:hypothetical protein